VDVSPTPDRSPGDQRRRADGGDADPSAAEDRGDGLRGRLRSALAVRLGIDARGLAAFRISLGLLVLADLAFRGRDLTAFYTDAGMFPREALAASSPRLARFSLHTLTGSTAGQAALFALAACAAVALTVGYRTRLATAATAVLHASLYARNAYLMNGGDGLLILGLFLGVFVPLGRRWSVDALRREDGFWAADPPSQVATLGTATLLAQLVVVYLANASFKLQSDAWMGGTAVQAVLELGQFSVGLGPALTAYPTLLTAVNWLWVAMLAVSPLLVLATGWRRTLLVAAYAAAHLGMLLTMRLGLFPLVVGALLLLYLPPSAWAWTEDRLAASARLRSLRERVDARVPTARSPTVPPSVRRAGRVAATVVVATTLVASVFWPATAVGFVDAEAHDTVPDPDGYTWTLFAPNPPSDTRWFTAPATMDTGETVDAIDGGDPEWDPPARAADTYPTTLWHRYLSDMRWADEEQRRYAAAYLCDRAERFGAGSATEVSLYVGEQRVESAGGGGPRFTELVQHDCSESR